MHPSPRPGPDASQATRWLAHAVAFALVACMLKVFVHWLASPFRGDPELARGFALGVVSDVGFGLLLSWPVFLGSARARLPLLAVLHASAFGLYAAAAHALAVLRHLPGWRSLAFLKDPGALTTSLEGHASASTLIAEALLSTLASLLMARALAGARQARSRTIAPIGVLCGLALVMIPPLTRGQTYHGATNPLLHVLRTRHAQPAQDLAGQTPTPTADGDPLETAFALVTDVIGTEDPATAFNRDYPYCRAEPALHPVPGARSVILLILESLGSRESTLAIEGKPVMPNFLRIAGDNLSFSRFYAAGDKSSQGMLGMLSGISAETHRRLLTHAPLVHTPSLARDLASVGYQSAYAHGSDLSFEQQRTYLRKLGYQHVFEPSSEEMRNRTGWGLPDGVMFERLRGWIEQQRAQDPSRPHFSTLFTLTTHDPYVLPSTATRVLQGEDDWPRFVNALAYLDAELGRFYQWYLREEMPKGTLLLMVGDHTGRLRFPGDSMQTTSGLFEFRFQVPFVIAGLSQHELARYRPYASRVGGHLDLPQTVRHLVGLDGSGCYQGRNLLGVAWPSHRYVVSLAGEMLERFYAHDGTLRWMWALDEGRVAVHDERQDPQFQHDLFASGLPDTSRLQRFTPAYFALGKYLNIEDHFAPPDGQRLPQHTYRPPSAPLLVAHRGNTEGAEVGAAENSLQAIDRAIAAKMQWVELDTQTTSDGVILVSHDSTFKGADGRDIPFAEIAHAELQAIAGKATFPTLTEALQHIGGRLGVCIELKSQVQASAGLDLVHGIVEATRGLPQDKVILDSFSRILVNSLREFTPFEIAYDLPQKPVEMAWLDYARDSGFHWVYVDHRFASPEVVEAAHARGLKVMLYTVDDPSALARLKGQPLDGIMTDHGSAWTHR